MTLREFESLCQNELNDWLNESPAAGSKPLLDLLESEIELIMISNFPVIKEEILTLAQSDERLRGSLQQALRRKLDSELLIKQEVFENVRLELIDFFRDQMLGSAPPLHLHWGKTSFDNFPTS